MDLQLLFRVVWRFKVVVLGGLVVATMLAVLSYARVSFDGGAPTLTYRANEQWESLSTIFVTSHGFPWGSAFDPNSQVILPNGTVQGIPQLSTTRLSALASLYQEYATSDPIYERLGRTGRIDGVLRTYPVFPGGDSSATPLPMITMSAVSPTPAAAAALNHRWINAFLSYIEEQQRGAKIPFEKRAVLQVIRQPQPATLLAPRKKTAPILVFVTVLTAFVGLAFVLENLRPRMRALQTGDAPPTVGDIRRTA
jgi:hypothetical protein